MQIEQLPEVRRFRSFLFPDLHAGIEAGRHIMLKRLQPLVIRLYDEPSTIKTEMPTATAFTTATTNARGTRTK